MHADREPRTVNSNTKETSLMTATIIEFDDMQAGMEVAGFVSMR